MKKPRMNLVAGIAVLVVFLGIAPVHAGAELKLGILPRLHTVELYTMFSPLAEYLSKETGEKVSIVIPKDFDAFKTAFRAGQLDLGFANPLIYVQLKKDAPLDPLGVSIEREAGARFRGIVITRKDSGIVKLQDLKGRKLAFVEKDSAGGYLFQMMLLKKAGLDIHRDFTLIPFTKKHDNVVMAVFNKAADAGGLREDDLEKMKSKVDLSKIRIIGYTDHFPNWPLFAAPALSKERAERVKTALLKLKPGDPRTRAVLGPSWLAGFAPIADTDYDQLRHAAKLVGAF